MLPVYNKENLWKYPASSLALLLKAGVDLSTLKEFILCNREHELSGSGYEMTHNIHKMHKVYFSICSLAACHKIVL